MHHRNNFTVILDFMGVIGDLDYVKLVMDLPTKQKYSTLRIFLKLLKTPKLKATLKQYQAGQISREDVEAVVAQYVPRASYMIPIILDKIPQYITVNKTVLKYIKEIRNRGARVYILSNTIPETESFIKDLNLYDICDDVTCSTEINMVKPNKEVYNYMIETYNLTPFQTIFIDDSHKNTAAAEKCGISTHTVSNSNDTCNILEEYLSFLDSVQDVNFADIML